jgi:predicted Fe-Mo cluster-binding NifX family protein
MKLAIPVWQSRISPVFDTAENLMIFEVEDGCEIARMEYPLSDLTPFRRAKRLEELHVDVLVCGAISRPLTNLMKKSGVKVIPWISGELSEVVPRFLDGQPLDGEFLMPGCAHRNRGCRRSRRRRIDYLEDPL